MSSCWKCGTPLLDGQVECEDGCEGEAPVRFDEAEVRRRIQEFQSRHVQLDWSQIQTVEQAREILAAWEYPIVMPKDSPAVKNHPQCFKPIK